MIDLENGRVAGRDGRWQGLSWLRLGQGCFGALDVEHGLGVFQFGRAVGLFEVVTGMQNAQVNLATLMSQRVLLSHVFVDSLILGL